MLPPLKIFSVQQDGDLLVVTPVGDATAFRYQDLQMEVNALRSHIARGKAKHLVINLAQLNYFGSEFIGSLVSMLRDVRNRRGIACICEATPQMLEVLQNMSLFKLWPYFAAQSEAVAHVQAEG